jgi:Flp pilus assembly protein TadG
MRRSLFRDVTGVSAVEFGLTAPILFMVIFGTFELAQAFYVRTILFGAMNQAARSSSLQSGQTSQATIDGIITTMIHDAMPKATLTFARKNYSSFSDVGRPEDFTDSNNNDVYDPTECFADANGNKIWDADVGATGLGSANDVVLYTVTVKYDQIFGFAKLLGLNASQTISANTFLRNQPFATQSTRTTVNVCP